MPALNGESPFKDDKSYPFVCSYQKAIDENPLSPTTEIRRTRCERVIDEMIVTEHSYINDLSQIITVSYHIVLHSVVFTIGAYCIEGFSRIKFSQIVKSTFREANISRGKIFMCKISFLKNYSTKNPLNGTKILVSICKE